MCKVQLRLGYRRGAPSVPLRCYSVSHCLGTLGRVCVISGLLGFVALGGGASQAAPFSVPPTADLRGSAVTGPGGDAPVVLVESVPEPEPEPQKQRDWSRTDNEDTRGRASWCSRRHAKWAKPAHVIEEMGSVWVGLLSLKIPATARHGAKSGRYSRCR